MKKKIKYIIAGGFASGTSFVSKSLAQDKRLKIIKRKNGAEYNFFVYDRYYKDKGIKWFENKFKFQKRVCIDHSSQLFNSITGIERLAKYNKNIKIILILRNRIERSWAHYRYSLLNGIEKHNFMNSLKLEKSRLQKMKGHLKTIKPYAYIDRSNYLFYLNKLLEFFPKKNLLIISSENLKKNPKKNFKKIYKFLNLSFLNLKNVSNFSSQYVINRKKQISLKNYFGTDFNYIIEKIRSEKTDQLKKKFNKKKIDELKNNLDKSIPEIPKDAKNYLKKIFKKDSKTLKKITSLDL
tara:strand:+ start:233 stop:1117 length:885 start_codon:yes stop_codon:yes gene_type:complete